MSRINQNSTSRPSFLLKVVPGIALLQTYQLPWLRFDFIAGITLAAYLLPSNIGTASLAQLPAQAGIYACILPGLVFWLFCSSRQTSITVTSAIALLLGSTLGEMAGGDAARFGALAACTALLMAIMALLAWIVRAGVLVNFISESVMLGFKAGVALNLAITQLPKLFGFNDTPGSFWKRSASFLAHLGATNSVALALGLGALGILVLGKLFVANKPVGLFVFIGGIVFATFVPMDTHGVRLLGEVPQGFPPVSIPVVHLTDLNHLLPLALACFLLSAVETAGIGRMFAAKHGKSFDANQEFLGLAAANLGAGIGQAFPVSGGMSQSLVNEAGGARTPISGLIAAGVVLLVSVFFASLLRNLPQPVLAATVLVAVGGLFKVEEFRRLFRADRSEFIVAGAALLGVLGSGLLRGVLIGAVISLVQLLRRASRPHVATLGRIPGTSRFSDRERHPDNEMIPGVIIFRVESGLLYFNIEYVHDTILAQARADSKTKLVVLDLSATPHVDLQSAATLKMLEDELAVSGTTLRVVETRSSVRDRLRAAGFDEKVGGINRFRSVAQAIEDFQKLAFA
jgi:high affinity sulfate transporter 1